MKLLVGLGNPGRDYRDTRHNVGFMVVDEVARRHQLAWAMAPGQVPDASVVKWFGPPPALLAKPLAFMNRSGDVVGPRLRVGVGRGDGRRDLADHVLARFESGEKAELEEIIARAADAVEMFAAADIAKVMNTYNPETAGPELD